MFFKNFKMKILISKFFVGNTPLGLPVKETFNDTRDVRNELLISIWSLQISS